MTPQTDEKLRVDSYQLTVDSRQSTVNSLKIIVPRHLFYLGTERIQHSRDLRDFLYMTFGYLYINMILPGTAQGKLH